MAATAKKKDPASSARVGVINHTAKLMHPMPRYQRAKAGEASPLPQAPRLRLLPGFNVVDAALWARVVDGPFVSVRIRDRMLEVIDGTPDLGRMDNQRAIDLIGKTFDRALLREWLESDERRPVRDALTAQMGKLDGSRSDAPKTG